MDRRLPGVRFLAAAALCISIVGRPTEAQSVDSSRRAALGQWWTTTPRYTAARGGLGVTYWGGIPFGAVSDGVNVWVTDYLGGSTGGYLLEVRASDGAVIGSWGGFGQVDGVVFAAGSVFFTVDGSPGGLYMFSPGQSGSTPVRVADVGHTPRAIAYGGSRLWTADGGRVSRITPGQTSPWEVTAFTGFGQAAGILYDGQNVWVSDAAASELLKLNTDTGAVVQTVSVGGLPGQPVFDGKHIWVPNGISDSVTVVDDATGNVVATLTGNGLDNPGSAAFDGERVLVTNLNGGSVSLWNAKDLSVIGTRSTGASSEPRGVCSDGVDFWIALSGTGAIGRF